MDVVCKLLISWGEWGLHKYRDGLFGASADKVQAGIRANMHIGPWDADCYDELLQDSKRHFIASGLASEGFMTSMLSKLVPGFHVAHLYACGGSCLNWALHLRGNSASAVVTPIWSYVGNDGELHVS